MLKKISGFFKPLTTRSHVPLLETTRNPDHPVGVVMNMARSLHTISSEPSEGQHRRNIEKIELAHLEQDRESINNNLRAQHRLMIVTIAATFVALFSAVSAIFIAVSQEDPKPPVVNVAPSQPDINVYVPDTAKTSPDQY